MTVRELIDALQGLINEDDNGSGVADMKVYSNLYTESLLPQLPRVICGEVWL